MDALESSRADKPREPLTMITVRLPQSVHKSLIAEAHRYRTSLNQLCITKLLQPVLDDVGTLLDR